MITDFFLDQKRVNVYEKCQWSFHVFKCVFHQEISSFFFGKSFLFLFLLLWLVFYVHENISLVIMTCNVLWCCSWTSSPIQSLRWRRMMTTKQKQQMLQKWQRRHTRLRAGKRGKRKRRNQSSSLGATVTEAVKTIWRYQHRNNIEIIN